MVLVASGEKARRELGWRLRYTGIEDTSETTRMALAPGAEVLSGQLVDAGIALDYRVFLRQQSQ